MQKFTFRAKYSDFYVENQGFLRFMTRYTRENAQF